jgi:septal ring factor EnvC (AmiA/AmiB activator)
MFAFLKRLSGREAAVAVKEKNQHLEKLERQGEELNHLLAKLEVATAAAEARTQVNEEERDRLHTSNSGQLRLRLDSTTDR